MFAIASTATAAGPGTAYRARANALQQQTSGLAAREHSALLDLYALDSQLGSARSRLAGLEQRSERLRAQQQELGRRVTIARRSLAISQAALESHLRALYESSAADPLAVVLGSQSLDDALNQLDALDRVAAQGEEVVAATTDARARLQRLVGVLADRRAETDAALAAARHTEAELESARAARVSFVADLRTRERLQTEQIARLTATAQRVEARSQALQAAAAAAPEAPAPAPAPADPAATDPTAAPAAAADPATAAPAPAAAAPAPAAASSGRSITVLATGYSLGGHTATGMPVGFGVVAVDPSLIPLGTRLTIPGYGEGVAADTGGAVRGAVIDLWFPTLAQARAWGRRTVTVTLH